MAITIVKEPESYWPICNDVIWTFESDETSQQNFSFIVEVYVNAILLSTHEVFPESGAMGKFNITAIGRSVLLTNFPQQSTLSDELLVGNTWSLLIYEKYGAPPVIDIGSSEATSGIRFLNGSFRFLELYPNIFDPLEYNIESTRGQYFLTDFPRNKKEYVQYQETKFLSIINSDGDNCTAEIKLYNISNTLITTATYAVNGKQVPMLSVGPSRLVASTSLNIGDFTNCYYYTVTLYQTATPTKTSESYKLYYDQSCYTYESRRLTWLNKFGAWDSFTFNLLSEDSTDIKSNQYERLTGRYTLTGFEFNPSDGNQMTMSKSMKDKLILNSDWIHQDVQQWLVRELYESPRVYIDFLGIIYLEPVNVTNANYLLKQRRKAGLIQEQVQIDRTYTKNSQLG
jgi:hypothetical protein